MSAALSDPRLLDTGLAMLTWLVDQQTRDGHLSVVGVGGLGLIGDVAEYAGMGQLLAEDPSASIPPILFAAFQLFFDDLGWPGVGCVHGVSSGGDAEKA